MAVLLGIIAALFAGNAAVVDAYPGGDFRFQFVAQQNAARASMGLPPLVWDERVASYARWYAQARRGDCALLSISISALRCRMQSGNPPVKAEEILERGL
ncbi:hypothetical protein PR202_ga02994 [Eleusine coracana subsp. coracana]|uniref:Uncharacterized protein n=1 Tax=Eleusine coracana subsp. coracana TaxID=191504 RepID=A0AAV5BKW7_ELECO|nr:hypothetical protein PR202_ga02994 [Eleusine coracana subsp. coracana]